MLFLVAYWVHKQGNKMIAREMMHHLLRLVKKYRASWVHNIEKGFSDWANGAVK